VKNLTRRTLAWVRTRRHDDRGVETAEVVMWASGAAVLGMALIARFTDIFNGVVDQVQSTLFGG
jgi:hypothetical protein